MTILIINFEYPPLGGGGGVATQLFAEELAARHTVHVLTTRMGELQPQETIRGVSIHRVRVFGRASVPTASLLSLVTFIPSALWRGWKIGRKAKFDVINAQFVLPSGIVGLLLSAVLKVPLVVSFIGGDLFDPSKGTSPHRHAVLRWLIRCVAARAQGLTAISEDTRRRAQKLHGVRQPIAVTHLGIKPLAPSQASRSSLQLPEDKPVFISIGRLIPRKNFRLLLEAWTQLPDAHLIILGAGPLNDELQQTVVRLNLTDRVQLRGFTEENVKQQLLQAADAYISSSDHEGFGIVFLEAMDAGLPIIATARGGQVDFLRPGENALLIPPGEADQLAAAAYRLLGDPGLAQRMGYNNKEHVQQFYLDRVTRRFEDVLVGAAENYAHRS